MGSDFTNFPAGCHGPVPLETVICSEDAAIHLMVSSRPFVGEPSSYGDTSTRGPILTLSFAKTPSGAN